jgi:hypothetical protein
VCWVSIGPRREQLLERKPKELQRPARPLRAVGE